ncbi:Uncharacterised protein [BD1-7 clade bacterium]|uniref:Glycosyl transferase family 1 domain-containing protein n=1 Tax=BD1-7 clade bacterium TaxID=2029982 RepID=A0A5S9N1C2_9GAMM|nr:Uncharacterised protein [BD1-7 clade bacterium]CAA0083163.1 Uncharacterised protein [BD1-7 clade bacterium]
MPRFYALFNHNPNDKIEDKLGFNLKQRLYFQPDLQLLHVNEGLGYLKTLWAAARSGDDIAIVTQRSYHALFGLIFASLFRNVAWIFDTPDCPLKEAHSTFQKYSFRWLISSLRGRLIYRVIQRADLIIINYSPKRFWRFYRGDSRNVHFFKNALPHLPASRYLQPMSAKSPINIVYIGHGLPGFGLDILITAIQRYNRSNLHTNTRAHLHIYGHQSAPIDDVTYHGKVPRAEVLSAIANAHLCASPLLRGSDLEYVYSIKTMEYFCYGNKLLISQVQGLTEQFEAITSNDIYFAKPGDIADWQTMLAKAIEDITAGKQDTTRVLTAFSAEDKNARIAALYQSVFQHSGTEKE